MGGTLGYIPNGNLNDDSISTACEREDSSDIRCRVKKDAPEKNVRGALAYIYKVENKDQSPEAKAEANITGHELYNTANEAFDDYFQTHRHEGATCDFGGVAMLVEESKEQNADGEEYYHFDDDEYFAGGYRGPKIWVIVVIAAAATFVVTSIGFVLAMRMNRSFNKKVREASFFRPVARSENNLLRSSLKLPALGYEEVGQHYEQPLHF